MTKMATMRICGKTTLKFETTGLICAKLGMYHRGLEPIIVCSNDDFCLFYYKVKFCNFWKMLEIIAACDLENGCYSALNE